MNDSPNLNVAVATHDRPELLRRAVGAIVDQEHPGDIDVVVVFGRTGPDEDLVVTAERAPNWAHATGRGI